MQYAANAYYGALYRRYSNLRAPPEIMPSRPAPKTDARYPLPLRLSGLWQALRGQRPRKRQRLAFVTLNRRRYKRVSFGDSAQAAAVEESFERYGPDARFPELVLRQENEIWVKFVAGAAVRRELASADGLADFFAGLYARERRPPALRRRVGAVPDARLEAVHAARRRRLKVRLRRRRRPAVAVGHVPAC